MADSETSGTAREFIQYETLDEGRIARIWLNRPEAHNAQNRGLLVQLDAAFLRAEADDDVRVIILAARGKNFSAGHDLGSEVSMSEYQPGPDQHPSFRDRGANRDGVEKLLLQEYHYFYDNTRRWRELRKVTIAQVQGNAISAALMLIWACDLIVAADNAKFSDVVGVRLGMPGVEYYAHPWEFGPRKAKELLLTGDSLDAEDAYRLGMVSKVFPRDELEEKTLEFARRIAKVPTIASLLIKDSVNAASDAMGFTEALKHGFHIHQLGHAHW
jgi:enoyl-CoA hydratase